MELSDLINQTNILDYISQYSDFELRNDGEYWGLSPLKTENTPSFSINTEKQKFFDFASGKGGNVLDFIQEYERCSLYKSVEKLKKYLNLEPQEIHNINKRLVATNLAKKYRIRHTETKGQSGIILKPNYMDRYDFDKDKLSLWEKEGISFETMQNFGVKYDPISERIVYPIKDTLGNIINVCGRTIDESFKEKGLRKYTYFKPLGCLDTIYGLSDNKDEILKKKEIILFEGAKSVMLAHEWGIYNCAAVLTSHLNKNQFNHLIRLGVRTVFAFDSDVDIRKDKMVKKLLPYTQVEWVRNIDNLLDDKDSPVDKGFEIFQELYMRRHRIK